MKLLALLASISKSLRSDTVSKAFDWYNWSWYFATFNYIQILSIYEHSRDQDSLLLTWISNHMPSVGLNYLFIPKLQVLHLQARFSDSICGLDIRTRYSDSIFGLDIQTRYSDSIFGLDIFGLDIRTRYSDSIFGRDSHTWFSDSIFALEFRTLISYFIPHIIIDVITGLPQSSQKIVPWLFPNCLHKF